MGQLSEKRSEQANIEARHYLLKEQRIRQAIADDIPLVLSSIEHFFTYDERAGEVTEVEHKAVRKQAR